MTAAPQKINVNVIQIPRNFNECAMKRMDSCLTIAVWGGSHLLKTLWPLKMIQCVAALSVGVSAAKQQMALLLR